MPEEKESSPPRRQKTPPPRRGVWLGRFVFLLVGVGGTMFYMEVREVGFADAVRNLQGVFVKSEEPSEPVRPLTGGRHIDAVDADTRPLHEQDARWPAAIALAEEGAKQREDALHDHYEGEGDPFKLRDQTGQAFDKITDALVDLRAMREEYSHSKSSRLQLDIQIERFAKIVDNMQEKNNRR